MDDFVLSGLFLLLLLENASVMVAMFVPETLERSPFCLFYFEFLTLDFD
jgi:hypothetical protein